MVGKHGPEPGRLAHPPIHLVQRRHGSVVSVGFIPRFTVSYYLAKRVTAAPNPHGLLLEPPGPRHFQILVEPRIYGAHSTIATISSDPLARELSTWTASWPDARHFVMPRPLPSHPTLAAAMNKTLSSRSFCVTSPPATDLSEYPSTFVLPSCQGVGPPLRGWSD